MPPVPVQRLSTLPWCPFAVRTGYALRAGFSSGDRGAHVARAVDRSALVLPPILEDGENERGNRKRELWVFGQQIGVQTGPNSKPYTPIVARFFRAAMNRIYTHRDRCPFVSCRRDHLRYICRPASPVPAGEADQFRPT